MNVLFVCAGNSCRSPLAAAFLNKLAAERGLALAADSAGIGVYGYQAAENAIMAARMWHADISSYRPKRLTNHMVDGADIVFTMERRHVRAVLGMQCAGSQPKAFSLLEYVGLSGDVADPYGRDFEAYEDCAKELWEAAEKLLELLVTAREPAA